MQGLVYGAFFPLHNMCDVCQERLVAGNCQWVKCVPGKKYGVNFIFPSNMGPNETVATKEATVYPQHTHLVTECRVRL